MSLFKTKSPSVRCGAIVDVGSGSVGMAIVVSDVETGKLDIVWSHREYILLKESTGIDELLKEINTTIMNALLELGGPGIKALHQFDPQHRIKYLQTSISAPWSYTVTKTISFEDDMPFEITKELIGQLVTTAKKQTLESEERGQIMNELGLRMITDGIVDVQLNGYSVDDPTGTKSRSIALSYISALAYEKILMSIDESTEKILPRVHPLHYSFMYMFFQVLKHLHPDTSEICLIDITNEATEVGIVRDAVLQHVTYAPFGLYTLAREIAQACSIPREEAYTLLKEGTDITKSMYSEGKQKEIDTIFALYEEKVAELLKNTGDTLSIPKTLFIHTSKNTEEFFSERLKNAATKATGKSHSIHLFTSELLGNKTMEDSALALSAHFFHTQDLYLLPLEI